MMDNLDVLDKYPECKTEEVLKVVYWRVNLYLDNIQNRKGYEERLPTIRPYIKEMIDRLDERIVYKYFNMADRRRYYDFRSPLHILEDGDEIKVPSKEFGDILGENWFLNLNIDRQDNDIRKLTKQINKLKKENNKLKKQNKKLKKFKKLYNTVINSRSWKITKPLRSFFNLFR
jgi:cell shape-determining protein MreC